MKTNIRYFPLLAMALASSLALAEGPPTSDARVGASSTHDCIVIVLDDSGSMNEGFGGVGRRLDAAKRGLKVVLRSAPKSTWVGLLALNAGWAYQLGPRDDARLTDVIDRIETSGGTPLARNIKAGADRLMVEREKQFGYGSYRLLVVTDGEETEDSRGIEVYPPEVRSRGLTLDVIGVGIGEEHALRKNAHSYRSADNPAALERAIREVLAERVDPGDQTGGGDAFALVAGLDPGVAQQMIASLGKLPNHPIGEQPPVASTGGGSSGGGGGGPTSVGPPGACGCRLAASPQPAPTTASGLPAASLLLLGLLAACLLYRTLVPVWRRR